MISTKEFDSIEAEEIAKSIPSVTAHLDELIRRAARRGEKKISSLGYKGLNLKVAAEVEKLYSAGGWAIKHAVRVIESKCAGDVDEPETYFVLERS